MVGESDRERDDGRLGNKWAEVAITVPALQLCHSDKVLLSIHNHQPKMKRCVVGIRRPGDPTYPTSERAKPSVWFPSMATMAAVLSEDNQALLRLIRDRQPKSLTALAELTGRQVPNLSRSLRMMEGYGLVKLKREGHGVEPEALATEFLIVLNDPRLSGR